MSEFKAGAKVRINNNFAGTAVPVGTEAVLVDKVGERSPFEWYVGIPGRDIPLAVYAKEISLIEEPLAYERDDADLRDAISALPGLEAAALTWNEWTDPVDFLLRYGEVLADDLEYYKRVEAKHHELVRALAVINNV